MKEMLAQRKAELEKQGKKGFTLMEMLIVVAIIAVLVAIAIPVFMTQLEQSRDATSVANMRSAYAEAMATYLTEGTDKDGKITVKDVAIETESNDPNWSGKAADLPFKAPDDPGSSEKRDMVFTFGDDGKITSVAFG